MVAPLAIAGGALAAGGLAGSIFGRKKQPKFDPSRINQLLSQGGEEQRQAIGQLRPQTDIQLNQFRGDIAGAQEKAGAAQEASRTRLLGELDPISSRLFQSQADQLKRTTFGAIPEAQQATREALAASGGLQRGVSAESLARVPLEATRAYSEGVADLSQESLRTMQDALQNLQSQESQQAARNLGIDQETYSTILNTGNAALINELNALVEESRGRTEGMVNADIARQTGNIAAAAGDEANRQALFQSLTGLGGNLLGAGLPTGVDEVSTARRTSRRGGQAENESNIEAAIRLQQQRKRGF